MKFTPKIHNVQVFILLLTSYVCAASWLPGCGHVLKGEQLRIQSNEVLLRINAMREEAGLKPLQTNESLMKTAMERAVAAAERGSIKQEENPLPSLVKTGIFARFALSHQVQDATVAKASKNLTDSPLGNSKIMHPPLTHAGFGFAQSKKGVFATMDLARLVPTIDREEAREALRSLIDEKRAKTGIEPTKKNDALSSQAQKLVEEYMNGGSTSDELLAHAQKNVVGQKFALGQITITFQVAQKVDEVIIPSITTDPKISFAGIGAIQGNHDQHEPGSLAVAILLARPQGSHVENRDISNLPPPKAAPLDRQPNKGSAVDQAWLATLTGNHRKAASCFYRAYQKDKEPKFLYESARAQARDGDNKAALRRMKEYALLVEGENKDRAEKLVKSLENGESIFSKSEESKMSVESKRFFVIGQRLYEQGEWEGAIDAFQQAYTYTKHPGIIYNIGLAYLKTGNIGDALDFFDEYLKYVPEAGNVDEARQLFDIGVELYQAGQFEAASRHFALSYAFLPFPELIYNLALCHSAMGQKQEALRFLNEFLDTDPDEASRKAAKKLMKSLSE